MNEQIVVYPENIILFSIFFNELLLHATTRMNLKIIMLRCESIHIA